MVDGHFERLICTWAAFIATIPAANGQPPDIWLQMSTTMPHVFTKTLPVSSQLPDYAAVDCQWLGCSSSYCMGREGSAQKNTVGHPGLWYIVCWLVPRLPACWETCQDCTIPWGKHCHMSTSDIFCEGAETPACKWHHPWKISVCINLSEKDLFQKETQRLSQEGWGSLCKGELTPESPVEV